jgi:outer membrane protein OmpA-like peptidoglycan-associated protein
MRRRIGRPGLVGTMARTAVITKTAQAVAGSGASRQQAGAQQAAMETQAQLAEMQAQLDRAQAPEPAPAASGDVLTGLQQLADLKSQGLLTDEEFAAAKAKLLQS